MCFSDNKAYFSFKSSWVFRALCSSLCRSLSFSSKSTFFLDICFSSDLMMPSLTTASCVPLSLATTNAFFKVFLSCSRLSSSFSRSFTVFNVRTASPNSWTRLLISSARKGSYKNLNAFVAAPVKVPAAFVAAPVTVFAAFVAAPVTVFARLVAAFTVPPTTLLRVSKSLLPNGTSSKRGSKFMRVAWNELHN